MKYLTLNGESYYIEVTHFEDKSEQDEEGYYEYYYEGKDVSFDSKTMSINCRIYDDEKEIGYLSKRPNYALGEDVKILKAYLHKEYNVKRFKSSNEELASI
ncbi:hypothetical protein ACU3L3_08060 [Priestia endophytica]|jgi:hypothetical protein|uniref:Uncharacterized protein n=1 Tax=Priestia endophytica DSM 13796 TaxID=1121089 RepID=A0A1I6ABQ4_9BACI|nr:hypothetical protein [Priestia endophytica]KYG27335.1 hypothetical protein AZF06_14055 [Priestia endophytica]MBG9814514.1 hypothetical protein [Priestia endophytica]SFQ66053.1 hypothetical protein SAMN02745910_02582 [Priestia endophytica DSM 13796]